MITRIIIAVLVILTCFGCTSGPNTVQYVVIKKLPNERVRVLSVTGRTTEFYVGSEYKKVMVGQTFKGPNVAGKHPVWVDGKVYWVTD